MGHCCDRCSPGRYGLEHHGYHGMWQKKKRRKHLGGSQCWCFKGRQEDVHGFNRNNIGNLTIIILLFRLYIHKIS